jgi:hypothetical protein
MIAEAGRDRQAERYPSIPTVRGINRWLLATVLAVGAFTIPALVRTANAAPTTHGPKVCLDGKVAVAFPSKDVCPPGTEMTVVAAGEATERAIAEIRFSDLARSRTAGSIGYDSVKGGSPRVSVSTQTLDSSHVEVSGNRIR